jgi:hypothetical protein
MDAESMQESGVDFFLTTLSAAWNTSCMIFMPGIIFQ